MKIKSTLTVWTGMFMVLACGAACPRSVLVHPDEFTDKWIDRAKAMRVETIAMHPVGGGAAHKSLAALLELCKDADFRRRVDRAISLGLNVEYEFHAGTWLLPRELFAAHPEYFRVGKDGKRTANLNFCASNEEALAIVAKRACAIVNGLYRSSPRYFFWLDDSGDSCCHCERCAKLSPSDQQLAILNRMLTEMRKVRPDAKLAYLAYCDTLVPPKTVKPVPGIFAEFAPIHRKWNRPVAEQSQVVKPDNITKLLNYFGRKDARVLEYWLDNSLFSSWTKPPKKFSIDPQVVRADLQWYEKQGFSEIATFACYLGPDYEKLWGEPDVSSFAKSIDVEPAPFCALRFGHQYTSPEAWKGMKAALRKNRGAFDEVWFSTGISFPKLAWHEQHAKECAEAANDLRALGIVPSIEIQTIIGHTDGILGSGDCSGQDWGTWVGADGTVSKHVSCPHDPKLAAYFAKVGELYAAWQPGSMWIDDDVTLRNRAPMEWSKSLFGCFCDRCVADFAKVDGRAWTREALVKAIRAGGCASWWPQAGGPKVSAAEASSVAARWEAYQCANFAALCKTIAAAVHKVSPKTVFGYQYGYSGRPAIVKGIYDGCGIPVRLRPGAGAYWDTDALQQLDKAYQLQWLSEMMGRPDWIGERCPEIETCPRTFACRTPQGIVLEAFENLALGLDNLSMFIAYSGAGESTEYYADTLFPRIRAAYPFLRSYREANRGTLPCGFTVENNEPARLVAVRGLPIVGSHAKSLGALPGFDTIKVRMSGSGEVDKKSREYQTRVMQIASSVELTNYYATCDAACGGRMPARFERAVRAFALPRVAEDGTLASLAVVNASIDRQEPVKVYLRNLAKGVGRVTWKTPEGEDVALEVKRDRQKRAFVTLPALGAWACGYLDCRKAQPFRYPYADFHARDLSKIKDAKRLSYERMFVVKDGRALMPIVYGEDFGHCSLQAARFLARCIKEMTGVEPPLIRDRNDGKCQAAPAFYIGNRLSAVKRNKILAAAGLAEPIPEADIRKEEFAVTAANGSYWFRGRSDHAVYDFCERILGVRWYWGGQDGLYAPKTKELHIEKWSWRDRPVFLMRNNWPDYHTDFGRYLRDSSRGPLALYPELHVHSSGGYKTNTNFNFWARCPDIYELDADGKRGAQFCFGNPRTLEAYEEIIQKGIDRKLRNIGILDFPSKSITVSQLDCGVNCHCDFCKKLYDDKMGPSGNASPCIWGFFVKNLSEWVADHYPDWTIVILPYINTCGCPEGLTFPRRNVVAMLCTMPGLALLKNERTRKHEEELILKWRKATGRPVENWHYSCWPNVFTCAPYVYSSVANGHYRRMAKENAVYGSFLNGGYDASRYFLSVEAWMKSLWNPDFDVKAFHDGFASRMYGPAAKPMRRVVELLENGWNRQWGNNQCSNRNIHDVSYPRAEVEEMERCFAEAAEILKAQDPVYLRRLNFWRDGCAEFFKASADHAKGSAFEPVRVQKVTEQPKIDGILDDPSWKLATATPFVPAFNKEKGAKPRDPGEVKVVWTPKGVTFGFRCQEHAIEHFQKTAAMRSFGNETFDIFLDPSGEGADIVGQLIIDARGTIHTLREEAMVVEDAKDIKVAWHVDAPKKEWGCELYIPYTAFKNFNGAKFPTTSANGVQWEGNISRWRIGDSALPKDKRPKDAKWEATRLWTRYTWFNKDATAFGKFIFVE